VPRATPCGSCAQGTAWPLRSALLLTAALAASPLPARAESAWLQPEGEAVGYVGLGLGTFAVGASGLPRDRQLRSRLDTYAAFGLPRGLQLSVDAPLMHNRALQDPALGPCPAAACAPVSTVGEVGVHLRAPLWSGGSRGVAGLGLRTDAWNVGTRDRWTNAGLGSTALVGSLVGEGGRGPWGAGAAAHYSLVFGRPSTVGDGGRWPADLASGSAWLARQQGAHRIEIGLQGAARLGGLEYDDWVQPYLTASDRWAALAWRALQAQAKWSLALGPDAGLHLGLSRVIAQANGPADLTDLSLGLHRRFGRRGGDAPPGD